MWSMSNDERSDNSLDDAAAPESAEVFEFGESTILQLRNQPFRVGDQYGTMMSVPLPSLEEPSESSESPFADEPQAVAPLPVAPEDPVARLERKLDLALRHIEALQQRLDSIDAALTRVLHR
jgi:hypothetical protein